MGEQTDLFGNPIYETVDGRRWGVSGNGDATQVDLWGVPVTPQPPDPPLHLPVDHRE